MRRMTAHGDNPSFTRAYRHRERRHIAGSVGTVGFEFEFDLGGSIAKALEASAAIMFSEPGTGYPETKGASAQGALE